MPKGFKANKPEYNYIDRDTIRDSIITTTRQYIIDLGYELNDPKSRKDITHNEINYILRQVYNKLFKPDKPLYNNQKSLLNYDDIKTLKILADTFIDICHLFNKSLGLISFSYMIGLSVQTMYVWARDESNPERSFIIKYIQESHKLQQISLLNDTPVGALAVANNDVETGLNWAANQAAQITNNTVYILPSERLQRLGIAQEQSKEGLPG